MPTDTPSTRATPNPPDAFDARTRTYIWLTGLFVTCLLLSNILGVKLFSFAVDWPLFGPFKIEHTVGMLTFPITFLLTDLLNEFYGKKAARRVTLLGFTMGLIAFVLIYLARKAPILHGIPGTATHESFENIFGAAALMYLASMIAFLVGSMLDIFLFGLFKRLTGEKMVWLRATGSTVISQLFDSFIVTFVFFQVLPIVTGGKPAGLSFVLSTAATGYVLKFFISIMLTPAIYAGRFAMRRWLGMHPIAADALAV
mgnify:CR=1 FL=1